MVTGDGIVDLRPRLHKFHSLVDVFRAQALAEAQAASDGVRPDVPLSEVELLPPLSDAGEDPVRRHQLRQSRPGL